VAGDCEGPAPDVLAVLAEHVCSAHELDVTKIADDWELSCAILELHALADEACASFGIPPDPSDPDEALRSGAWKEYHARGNDLLGKSDSLSHFSGTLVQVLPKMRTPQTGIALRSLSAHLAIARFPEVDVLWSHVQAFANEKSSLNLLLLPAPPGRSTTWTASTSASSASSRGRSTSGTCGACSSPRAPAPAASTASSCRSSPSGRRSSSH
jgi:hypothetical protein